MEKEIFVREYVQNGIFVKVVGKIAIYKEHSYAMLEVEPECRKDVNLWWSTTKSGILGRNCHYSKYMHDNRCKFGHNTMLEDYTEEDLVCLINLMYDELRLVMTVDWSKFYRNHAYGHRVFPWEREAMLKVVNGECASITEAYQLYQDSQEKWYEVAVFQDMPYDPKEIKVNKSGHLPNRKYLKKVLASQ